MKTTMDSAPSFDTFFCVKRLYVAWVTGQCCRERGWGLPLYQGIRAFEDTALIIEEDVLLALYDQRESYLRVLRADPDLVEKPYPYASPFDRTDGKPGYVVPGELPDENPIYIALVNAGLLEYGRSVLMGDDLWQRLAEASQIEGKIDKRTYGEGYSLIDAALYVTFLINIYQPNRALVQNLFATHVQEDALGRNNLNAVTKAVEKVVKRSIGSNDHIYIHIITNDLVAIAKHEAAQSSAVNRAGRGLDFERQCRQLLELGGFEVRTTPITGDYGADLIALKDDLGFAIQCKDTGKPAGVKAIQEAAGARRHYLTDYAVVCCSGGFTDAAIELATSNKVLLCNADQIVRQLDAA